MKPGILLYRGVSATAFLTLMLALVGTESFAALRVREATEVFQRKEVQGKAYYLADSVTLEEGDSIIFNENATIFVKKMELQPGSTLVNPGNRLEIFAEDSVKNDGGVIDITPIIPINNFGANGDPGPNGPKAADALMGGAGGDGVNGGAGGDGVNAKPVKIWSPRLRGSILVNAYGGNGGSGGNAGAGGAGGKGFSGEDARILYRFRGMENLPIDTLLNIGELIGVPVVGQVLAIMQIFNGITIGDGFDGYDGGKGGNGGRGGDGGRGGNGGNVDVSYGEAPPDARVIVNNSGGKGGAGGAGGVGGAAGPGGEGGKAGDLWGKDGKNGNSGNPGLPGIPGRAGAAGEGGEVTITEYGNAKWMECYTRYRQIRYVDEDPELAQIILQSCSR